MGGVILGGEAVAAGVVTRHELRRWYTNLYRGVYIPKDREPSLRDRAVGAWLVSRRRGVVAGLAAAVLHGAPRVDPTVPIELVGAKCAPQDGLIPRTERVADDEITTRFGLPVTTTVRTAFDLGRHLDRADALARMDALMWNQEFSIESVLALADRYPRARGNRQLRDLLPLVDGGAESPHESTTRLWLHDAGFSRPETQIPVLAGSTQPVAWLDMGWRDFMVAVEYVESDVRDVARLRMLKALGWSVIQVVADANPHDWLAGVADALYAAGCGEAFAA